ncbi:MAG TPA: lysophospholipid acyltransferase family protein [Negativicutes bacterium]|nr:lysophospholipid acyltransferase family protein [Negativicutes bacterium]
MVWQYHLLRGSSWLISRLPYSIVLRLGAGIGFLHWFFGHSQRRRAITQLQERLGVSEKEAAAIARRMFGNIGKTLLEVLYIPALTPEKMERWVSIENLHYLTEAMSAGHGTVVLTAHFGNWEWLAARLVQAGFPVAAIAETQPNPGLDLLLNEHRTRVGLEPYARGNALIAAMKALKNGHLLGFLADQDAKASGVFVNFFGRLASTPQGPAVFAQRCRAPIVPAFIVRQPRRGHRILLSPPIYGNGEGDPAEQILTLTSQMTEVMEERIRRYPDHWWWFQRRWITDPKTGETSGVKK